MNRREFAGALAATALSQSRVLGANERLRIGIIGCGGMATGHMRALNRMKAQANIEVGAVCDVYDKRIDAAAQLTGGTKIKEYRRLLESKDIDYVLVATPEHWHYQMAVEALDAGKHVYVEKPMCFTAEEARKLALKMKTSKQKLQVGVQGMSDDSFAVANKYVTEGALGKVVLAQIDYSRNHQGDFFDLYKPDPDCKPGVNLDWKAWLGPAKKHDFVPDRFFNWRRYWDYSHGIASDLFVHRVTRIIKSLGLGFPERGVGAGGKFVFPESTAEIPDTLNMLIDYPGGPTIQLVSSMANDTRIQYLLRGHKATLEFTATGFTITPQALYKEGANVIEYKRTGAESIDLHHMNLQDAIRTGVPVKCDAELGYKAVVAVQLGSLSYRRHKYMAWDKTKEKIVNA